MKFTIASWILESLVAAAVVVLCVGIPSAYDLPLWTLALSAIPMFFYLSWRLDRERFSWRFTLLMAGILGAGVLIQACVVARRWSSGSFVIFICIFILASYLRRKREQTHHVA
jgi:hypothetical protein